MLSTLFDCVSLIVWSLSNNNMLDCWHTQKTHTQDRSPQLNSSYYYPLHLVPFWVCSYVARIRTFNGFWHTKKLAEPHWLISKSSPKTEGSYFHGTHLIIDLYIYLLNRELRYFAKISVLIRITHVSGYTHLSNPHTANALERANRGRAFEESTGVGKCDLRCGNCFNWHPV